MYRLKVKEVANSKKITQSKLSRLADINNRTMHLIYYEPTTANITMSTLDKIAVALGVDISELIESVKKDGTA